MKPQFPLLLISLCILAACKPEVPYIQQNASDVATASAEWAEAASVAAVSVPVMSTSAVSGVASAPVAASAASAVVASAASAPAVPEGKIHKTKKVPIGGSEEFGNTTFYFPASIKKEGKLYYVLTENRFKTVQKLPESGKPFLYSLIKEAVDCELKLTDPVSVTHFSEKDEVVEKHDFPYPDYKSWNELELEALSNEHPDRPFINAVCQNAKPATKTEKSTEKSKK